MIVVDTSALIALLLGEPEAVTFLERMIRAERVLVGAPTAFEFLMVAQGGRIEATAEDGEAVFRRAGAEFVAWTPPLAAIAHRAFLKFGKGRHPASLNFGDCMSYALAKSLDCPLLYKGDEFARTDIMSALPAAQ